MQHQADRFRNWPARLSLARAKRRDLDELQRSFKERYSRLLEKRLRTEHDSKLLEQAAPGSTGREPAPPADSRGGGGRGRSAGSEEGGM